MIASREISVIKRPEFVEVTSKLLKLLPTLDSGYMVEALVAMAELRVKDAPLLVRPPTRLEDPLGMRALTEQRSLRRLEENSSARCSPSRAPAPRVPQTAFFDTLASRLHSFTAPDAARCLFAFNSLGLAQAPAYPRMMRTVDKQLHTLPATLIAQLLRAIVPQSRAAACSRLLPRLANALAHAMPPLDFAELLTTARLLCRRLPLPEPLLMQVRPLPRSPQISPDLPPFHGLRRPSPTFADLAMPRAVTCLQLQRVIAHELSSEGEGSLAGNLQPEQIATSLWLFVRHLPVIQQTSPHSPLLNLIPPLVEQVRSHRISPHLATSRRISQLARRSLTSHRPRPCVDHSSSSSSPTWTPYPQSSSATWLTSSRASSGQTPLSSRGCSPRCDLLRSRHTSPTFHALR